MINISVVIITLNEEANIGRCIEAVLPFADDIVVMDSFSTDATAEICARYPIVQFFQHAFDGYTPQKNRANALAKHPWILSLDADEVVSEELRQSILAIKAEPKADAYTFNLCTNYLGQWIRHGSWYPDRKLRLFDQRKGQWEGYIHEKIVMQPGSRFAWLKGDLLHYSYTSFEQHLRQSQTYSFMVAQDLYKKGKRSSWFKLWLNPWVAFLKSYVFKRGFMDGYYGYVIARMNAFWTFAKYAQLRELERQNEKRSST